MQRSRRAVNGLAKHRGAIELSGSSDAHSIALEGNSMKKKSPRGIPDFSRKSSGSKGAPAADPTPSAKPARAPQPHVKPQAMPSKAGQRGQ
jgi:hypothetical protein